MARSGTSKSHNYRCSDCGRRGHNVRTCDDPDVLAERMFRELASDNLTGIREMCMV